MKNVAAKNAKVINMLDGYAQKTQAEQTKIQAEMIKHLNGFVISLAKKFVGRAEFEDLRQEGYLAIIESIDNYDPMKSMPTTYFNPYILHAMQRLCDGYMSQYYSAMRRKLNSIVQKYIADSNDPYITNMYDISDEELADISGVSIKTVKEVKWQSAPVVTLETIENAVVTEYTFSPEDVFLQMENTQNINDCFKVLTPLESFIVIYSYNETKKKSIRAITRKVNSLIQNPELAKILQLDHAVNSTFIKEKMKLVLNKLEKQLSNMDNDIKKRA